MNDYLNKISPGSSPAKQSANAGQRRKSVMLTQPQRGRVHPTETEQMTQYTAQDNNPFLINNSTSQSNNMFNNNNFDSQASHRQLLSPPQTKEGHTRHGSHSRVANNPSTIYPMSSENGSFSRSSVNDKLKQANGRRRSQIMEQP